MTARPSDQRDPRDVPNYTLAESARWLGLVPTTMRVWFVDLGHKTKAGTMQMQRIVRPARAGGLELSFWNLVECSVVASIRTMHRVSFPQIRRALDYAQRQMDVPRQLIQQQFATDGVDLFVERLGKLIAASEPRRTAMRGVLAASLARIERDNHGLAARLFPWRHRPDEPMVVSVDPHVSFGRPVLAHTGITVEVLLGRFWAGDTIEHLARDYRVAEERIEGLVRWSGGARAA